MGKRRCPFEEDNQPVKKQINEENSKQKIRNIKSEESEKTLQLLFKGAAKQFNNEDVPGDIVGGCNICLTAMAVNNCAYCNTLLCEECLNNCNKCNEQFCRNCSFFIYELNHAVCYSCY